MIQQRRLAWGLWAQDSDDLEIIVGIVGQFRYPIHEIFERILLQLIHVTIDKLGCVTI